MGDYLDADVGVLRMRSLPNFWLHASCDHAVRRACCPPARARRGCAATGSSIGTRAKARTTSSTACCPSGTSRGQVHRGNTTLAPTGPVPPPAPNSIPSTRAGSRWSSSIPACCVPASPRLPPPARAAGGGHRAGGAAQARARADEREDQREALRPTWLQGGGAREDRRRPPGRALGARGSSARARSPPDRSGWEEVDPQEPFEPADRSARWCWPRCASAWAGQGRATAAPWRSTCRASPRRRSAACWAGRSRERVNVVHRGLQPLRDRVAWERGIEHGLDEEDVRKLAPATPASASAAAHPRRCRPAR